MEHWLVLFIINYGYLAIFVGSILEGETVLVLGGLAAHQGYLSIVYVFLFSFFGAMVGDFGWFLLGRIWGERILNRFLRFKKMTSRMMGAIHRRPGTLSFLLRFLYGLRHIVPFSIGMSKISPKKFFALNASGALLWGAVMVGIGYFLGLALEAMLGKLRRIQFVLVVFILLIAFGLKGFIHLSRFVGEKLGFSGVVEV
ncbi:MAG: DedA family protein [bacterium]|nr:DedA family protein [bacterium]